MWHVVDARLTFVEDQTEWNGTDVVFEIAPKGDKTELRFTHAGLVPSVECYDGCSGAWGFYVNESLRSLRSLITTGKGQPNEKQKATRKAAARARGRGAASPREPRESAERRRAERSHGTSRPRQRAPPRPRRQLQSSSRAPATAQPLAELGPWSPRRFPSNRSINTTANFVRPSRRSARVPWPIEAREELGREFRPVIRGQAQGLVQ